jgi:hypothetical protein
VRARASSQNKLHLSYIQCNSPTLSVAAVVVAAADDDDDVDVDNDGINVATNCVRIADEFKSCKQTCVCWNATHDFNRTTLHSKSQRSHNALVGARRRNQRVRVVAVVAQPAGTAKCKAAFSRVTAAWLRDIQPVSQPVSIVANGLLACDDIVSTSQMCTHPSLP